jgi:TRAP transporter TAXI family solute receptor
MRHLAHLYRHGVLIGAMALLLAGIPLPAQSADRDISAVLKGGGGAVGGIGHVVMIAIAQVVKDMYPRIDITTVPGGWVGNIYRTDTGEMDLATTNVTVAHLAKAVKPPFEKPFNNVRSLLVTQEVGYYIAIVRKDFPADNLNEIFEKKIPARLCTLYTGNVTELVWRNIFQYYNASWDDIAKWGGKMNFVPWPDAVNLVKDGHADGILARGAEKIGWAVDLATARPIKILKFTDKEMDYLKKTYDIQRGVIPGNSYPGISENVICPADVGMSVVNKDVPDDVVTAILTALWEGADKFAKYHAMLADFKREKMCETMPLPLHPAAEKFYKEKGCMK